LRCCGDNLSVSQAALSEAKNFAAKYNFVCALRTGCFDELFWLLEERFYSANFEPMKFWVGTSGFSVRRVEGKLLSGRLAGGKNVAVLCRTPFDYGNQLHVSSDSCARDDR
jgi:hypothetical protein